MAMTLLYCRVVGSIECIREVPACPRIKAIDSPASVGGNAQELEKEKKKNWERFSIVFFVRRYIGVVRSPRSPLGKGYRVGVWNGIRLSQWSEYKCTNIFSIVVCSVQRISKSIIVSGICNIYLYVFVKNYCLIVSLCFDYWHFYLSKESSFVLSRRVVLIMGFEFAIQRILLIV